MAETASRNRPEPADKSELGYRISFDPHGRRIRVVFNDETVADSSAVMVLRETRLPPVFYFPRADVRMDLMTRTERLTHCPFKGNATYWTLAVGGRAAENAVWGYEDPIRDVGNLKDYVAFYWDEMDAWLEDGEAIAEPPGVEEATGFNPFVDWLLRDAWDARDTADLVARLAECLTGAGVPLWRLRLVIRTLHPQLFATGYGWLRDEPTVTEVRLSHEVLQSREYLESPFAPILEGAGGVRRRLNTPDAVLDYPILKELQEAGATDYAAMPMPFSDGQINVLTLVADNPDGFSANDLGKLHEIMPVLSRLLEVHAMRQTATTLLETYLGKQTGEQVLEGLIKRGDGKDLHAVIWFCDLRGSTALSEAMSREAYLALLNQFFECMAGAVLDHGGEVLKFIGDAVLAIFPIRDPGDPSPEASRAAVAAARDAQRRVAELNREREGRGEAAIEFGVGLHRGDLTYGNIGTPGRLDFTVIGAAANEAARIEDLCKVEGQSILVSATIANSLPDDLVPLGRRALRGVSSEQEIFALGAD